MRRDHSPITIRGVIAAVVFVSAMFATVPEMSSSQPFLVEHSIQDLQSDIPNIRIRAAERLAEARDAQSITALRQALQDEEVLVRLWATYALKQIGSTRALASLRGALTDPNLHIRLLAAEALQHMKSRRPT